MGVPAVASSALPRRRTAPPGGGRPAGRASRRRRFTWRHPGPDQRNGPPAPGPTRIGRYNRTMKPPAERSIPVDLYRQRRERVLAALRAKGGGVAIVPTAPEVLRNRDAHYPYRHDSYFYYLTGFTEPDALLVLDAGSRPDQPASILFCRAKNLERETWEGFRFGPEGARDAFASTPPLPSTKSTRSCRASSRTPRRCTTRSALRRNATPRCAAGSMPCARKAVAASSPPRRCTICCRCSTTCG